MFRGTGVVAQCFDALRVELHCRLFFGMAAGQKETGVAILVAADRAKDPA